jgi:hypothetical protein
LGDHIVRGLIVRYSSLSVFIGLFLLSGSVSAELSNRNKDNELQLAKVPSKVGVIEANFELCIQAAERDRSNRDLEFFLRARRLITPKEWFISHARQNEARFCDAVSLCQMKFDVHSDEALNIYPECL